MSLRRSIIFAFLLSVGAVHCFPESRVVNGTDSSHLKYPFIASLRYSSGSHSCGCSIIAPNWLLTAAHCVGGNAADLTIQYAVTNISAAGLNVARVKRYIIHENYTPANAYANDIALIELQGTLIFNDKTIAAVNLPEPYFEIDQLPTGAPGVLIGWGRNETGGSVQTTLQEVDLKIYSDEECNSRHNGVTSTDQLCGGVDEGGMGQCSGDSGGPLLYEGNVQLGIVSWSIKPCAVYPYPGVYTKVSHYVDWIYSNIE